MLSQAFRDRYSLSVFLFLLGECDSFFACFLYELREVVGIFGYWLFTGFGFVDFFGATFVLSELCCLHCSLSSLSVFREYSHASMTLVFAFFSMITFLTSVFLNSRGLGLLYVL